MTRSNFPDRVAAELVQIAAMCQRAAEDTCADAITWAQHWED